MNLPTRLLCPWNFPDWLPFPTSGHLPDPGIETGPPVGGRFFTSVTPGDPGGVNCILKHFYFYLFMF